MGGFPGDWFIAEACAAIVDDMFAIWIWYAAFCAHPAGLTVSNTNLKTSSPEGAKAEECEEEQNVKHSPGS